jgi:hypothetical protein
MNNKQEVIAYARRIIELVSQEEGPNTPTGGPESILEAIAEVLEQSEGRHRLVRLFNKLTYRKKYSDSWLNFFQFCQSKEALDAGFEVEGKWLVKKS